MYKFRIGDKTFTMPKENIRLLAMIKAQDRNDEVDLRTDSKAIKYLKSIGLEIWERK